MKRKVKFENKLYGKIYISFTIFVHLKRFIFVYKCNSGGRCRIWRAGEKRRIERSALFRNESVFKCTTRNSSRSIYSHGNNQSGY